MVSQTIAIWILLTIALAAANLPFVSERLFGLIPLRKHPLKPGFAVVAEISILYLLVGLLGSAFEAALVNPFARGWEFYAITFCIFLVLGFPGFVFRYLLKP
jgi:hypothetical protein